MSKASKLRELSDQELETKLKEVTVSLNQFYTLPKEKLEKLREKSALKRERARILTLIKERLLQIERKTKNEQK